MCATGKRRSIRPSKRVGGAVIASLATKKNQLPNLKLKRAAQKQADTLPATHLRFAEVVLAEKRIT